MDTTFGGFDGNPSGIAYGDGQYLYTLAQQSTGRIIAGGLSQDNLGLLLGYTANGKLDTSFGNNGYQTGNTGASGIYTTAVDTKNRIVIAYNVAGAVLDSSFDASVSYIATVTSNSNMKIAIGG